MILLNQRIDFLNLSTLKEKLIIITLLHFLIFFRKLKTFFDLIN